jgi:hypothetical protein
LCFLSKQLRLHSPRLVRQVVVTQQFRNGGQ